MPFEVEKLQEIAIKAPKVIEELRSTLDRKNDAEDLSGNTYKYYDNYLSIAEKAIEGREVALKAELTEPEKALVAALHTGIKGYEQLAPSDAASLHLLISIANKDPNIIEGLLNVLEGNNNDRNSTYGYYSKLLRSAKIEAGLEEEPDAEKVKSSSLKSFLVGAAMAMSAIGVGLGTEGGRNTLDKFTKRLGTPLTPESQIIAIVEDPEKLEAVVKRLEEKEGHQELIDALRKGDVDKRTSELYRLRAVVNQTLTEIAEESRVRSERAGSLKLGR